VIAPPSYNNNAGGSVVWSSPAGGAAFASGTQGIANGGQILTAAPGDLPSGGAVALDATHIAVYGDHAPFGNGVTDFTLASPAPPATPVADLTGDFGVQISAASGQLASVPDPTAPGQFIVVAVGGDASTPAGCPAAAKEGTGYGVGVGTPAALQTQSAWASKYFVTLDCSAFAPTLDGGGPSGGTIGLLEEVGPGLSTGSGANGVYYRRFDTSTMTFGPAVLVSDETKVSPGGPIDLSVSKDGAGNVDALWLDHRGVVLAHSTSDGASWPRPVVVRLGNGNGGGDLTVLGAAAGTSEIAYTANPGSGTQEYLVRVDDATGGGA